MSILDTSQTFITRDESSPVRSHQSYDPQVHAICHHSGQYLTWEEANHPIWKRLLTRLLREQHDFPGLRSLDRAFAKAAHSNQHQHIVWSRIAIQSIALFISGPVLILLVIALWDLQDFVPLLVWYFYLAGLMLFGLGGIALIGIAVTRYQQRESIFHKRAAGSPPAIADFPVQGEVHVNVREELHIDLDNIHRERPKVTHQQSVLSASLHPIENNWESYEVYRQQYQAHAVGQYIHGGAVALENLKHVYFLDNALEFDHRLVLRVLADKAGISTGKLCPFTLSTRYEILSTALYPPYNGLERFPLECEPRLSTNDSRTLELHFHWRGQDPLAACRLEECILDVPDALAPVTKVTFGRYDHEKQKVFWRNRSFRQQSLILSVSFEKPILECHELVKGTYHFSYDGLLSQIHISPDHIWTVLGTPAAEENCYINRQTAVRGTLTLGLQWLSQEHEHIKPMPPITCPFPPDEKLVEAVLEVLLEEGFDIQRMTRAAPRLDPTGRLDRQLFYWDIIGRRYDAILLDSLDVHVVITGSDKVLHSHTGNGDNFQPKTHIDLRVRCLYDPRNTSTPEAVEALVGREDANSLATKINDAVMRSQSHLS